MRGNSKQNKVKLLYLLGAGRSGTTLIAAALNNTDDGILSVGELHQFREHLIGAKLCSCGKILEECKFWKGITAELAKEIEGELEYCEKKEEHRHIPKLLILNKSDKVYLKPQIEILSSLGSKESSKWILDSSKYIARYLLLSKSKQMSIKGVYVVRDIRGVIYSFSKKVQTPKSPIATIFYYVLINLFGQLTFWLDSRVIKVRYEDFVENPNEQLGRIQRHVFGEVKKSITLSEELEMPHIMGGNRMKHNKTIVISPDYKWKKTLSRRNQILYYCAVWPFMLLNGYKI